ncbi:AAA family ATPase [Streptosporangium vulgare]|uniref:AAA family ATPase n=1 Tax=Streptosporangium vulgare TaxID=46190 RepID=A0ABV5THV7_9ACTN
MCDQKGGQTAMRRYILTGTPGAGKTTPLRAWRPSDTRRPRRRPRRSSRTGRRGDAEPWTLPSFIDKVVALQRRQLRPVITAPPVQFFDRSPVCTHALNTYAGQPVSSPCRPAPAIGGRRECTRRSRWASLGCSSAHRLTPYPSDRAARQLRLRQDQHRPSPASRPRPRLGRGQSGRHPA